MLKIYDNGGKTWDRYTVIIDDAVFGMSDSPLSPDGFNQYCGTDYDEKSLGKEIGLSNLNNSVRVAIKDRLIEKNILKGG